MSKVIPYHLVHVLSFQEYRTPLVRTQLFEQANAQISLKHSNAPLSVEVWILVPFRTYWDSVFKNYLKELRSSYPKLKFRVIGGMDRMRNFPQAYLIYYHRKSLGLDPTIFHFRGDDLLLRFAWLKILFTKDRYVADIRGLWPAEFLLNQKTEVFTIEELESNSFARPLIDRLKTNLEVADALSSVTLRLVEVVKKLTGFKGESWVVPCAISKSLLRDKSNNNQSEPTEFQIGYLGGVASYQNLPELVLPFMDAMIRKDSRVRVLLITHQPEEMKELIQPLNWESGKFELISVPQNKVHTYLKSLDVGLMIRKRNLVNEVAQPVKIGEYLAAGVPVLIQSQLGGLDKSEFPGMKELDFEQLSFDEAAEKVIHWLESTPKEKRFMDALTSAEKLTWENNIAIHRDHYQMILNQ
jgi:glycosyltransferase involved in cell wall biosynthesis